MNDQIKPIRQQYFKEFLTTNSGNTNPYHNLRHALRVVDEVAKGLKLLAERDPDTWTPQKLETLLVAALFHDWGHPGKASNDVENVNRAAEKVLSLPKEWNPDVDLDLAAEAIRGTQFPFLDASVLTPVQEILRDADVWHQAMLSYEDWFDAQVGLATELGIPLNKWFGMTEEFVGGLLAFGPRAAILKGMYQENLMARARDWAAVLS